MTKYTKKRSSSDSAKHPYLRLMFWIKPDNQFWESDLHTERSKKIFRDRIKEMFDAHRNTATI